MVKKILPPLDDKNQIANLASSGEWKSEDASFLEKLAKGLKLGSHEEVSSSDINSVPDIWARVLIVRNALVDNHKFLVNEWRGTLALLALAPYYTHIYDLNSDIVSIQDIKNSPFANQGSANGGLTHIGRILFDVKPKDTMVKGQDWNAVGVLNFKKKDAIAIVNPYTLVASARDYTQIPDIKKLPWYEDGFLIDPCNAKDMRNEQYRVLEHYLDNLISGIQSVEFSNGEVYNAVLGRLQEFKADCTSKARDTEFSSWTRYSAKQRWWK